MPRYGLGLHCFSLSQKKDARLIWVKIGIYLVVLIPLQNIHATKIFQRTIVNVSLLIISTYVLGAQKNRLIETVLLSFNNICFC